MCLLIVKPKGVVVPADNLRHANKRNSHGIGMAWIEDGVIHMWKALEAERIEEAVEKAAELEPFDAIIHLRFATHGEKTIDNVHPFFANEAQTVAMAHNGILRIPTTKEISDSRMFANEVLARFSDHWWRSEVVRVFVENGIGGDRVAILTVEDGPVVFNRSRWSTEGGVLYSNSDYKPYKSRDWKSDHDWNGSKYGVSTTRPAHTPSTPTPSAVERYVPKSMEPEPIAIVRGIKCYTLADMDRALGGKGSKRGRSKKDKVPSIIGDPSDPIIAFWQLPADGSDKPSDRNRGAFCQDCCPPHLMSDDQSYAVTLSYAEYMFDEPCKNCKRRLTDVAIEVAEALKAIKDAANVKEPEQKQPVAERRYALVQQPKSRKERHYDKRPETQVDIDVVALVEHLARKHVRLAATLAMAYMVPEVWLENWIASLFDGLTPVVSVHEERDVLRCWQAARIALNVINGDKERTAERVTAVAVYGDPLAACAAYTKLPHLVPSSLDQQAYSKIHPFYSTSLLSRTLHLVDAAWALGLTDARVNAMLDDLVSAQEVVPTPNAAPAESARPSASVETETVVATVNTEGSAASESVTLHQPVD